MNDPFPKNGTYVPLAERNHEVQALAPDGADQAFADAVRLWHARGRLEHPQTHRLKGSIDTFRIDAVSIVDHESWCVVAQDNHSKLLGSPVGRGMRGHIPVQEASCSGLTRTTKT